MRRNPYRIPSSTSADYSVAGKFPHNNVNYVWLMRITRHSILILSETTEFWTGGQIHWFPLTRLLTWASLGKLGQTGRLSHHLSLKGPKGCQFFSHRYVDSQLPIVCCISCLSQFRNIQYSLPSPRADGDTLRVQKHLLFTWYVWIH